MAVLAAMADAAFDDLNTKNEPQKQQQSTVQKATSPHRPDKKQVERLLKQAPGKTPFA
jgi:hypothetical protein